MENTQTAVDWLIYKCNDSINKEPDNPTEKEIGYSKALFHIVILLEQAKEMEKEQIIRAYLSGQVGEMYELKNTLTAKQYYDNNYGNANN